MNSIRFSDEAINVLGNNEEFCYFGAFHYELLTLAKPHARLFQPK